MITITAKVTGGAVFQQLKQLEDRILDLRPVLNKIPETILFPSVMRSFAAGGRPAWRFKGYQSSPPMVKTGLMKRALTTRDASLNRISVTSQSLSFDLLPGPFIAASMRGDRGGKRKGPGVFYPAVHQYGGSRHFQNLVLELQPDDFERMSRLIVDYCTEGKLP